MDAQDPYSRGGLRRARLDESALLTDLVFRSKAYWGYLPEYLETWREEMRVTPEKIAEEQVYVYEQGGRVIGYLALRPLDPETMELDDLFVAPEGIGQGVGRRLWDQAVALGRSEGFRRMIWDADPFAEPFYRHMGAQTVGFKSSTYFPERLLPRMVYDLE
ncbi:MAG: GNAT family N-acetyltransferase [Anaerolineae bacterium]|nr:GNAT family N-acetyltransferase [Anaerolineae bacterium]NUQ06619.1 GNAT family N-acetyltransferase [Anaerolineae bacterium]